jgi:hypothetical protein
MFFTILPWLMLRGITMQRAVDRDSENHSNYVTYTVTRAESHPLSVMRRFVKLLTVLLPAPPPCLR